MVGYGTDLSDYGNVRQSAVTVYDHLASRSMPLTTQESEFWPEPALVPPPVKPAKLRVRRNILDLTTAELNDYRRRLEELQIADSSPSSPWQQLAHIHTDWCLHYQEAFVLWHRANVLYFEQMIGCPVTWSANDIVVAAGRWDLVRQPSRPGVAGPPAYSLQLNSEPYQLTTDELDVAQEVASLR